METLVCRREMSFIGSTSFGFAQNSIHDFQHTVLNSKWHCLRQMLQKPLDSAIKTRIDDNGPKILLAWQVHK